MTWFRVDDGLPTSRKVLGIPRQKRAAAIGVWTLAGAWAAGELTDGFVPDYVLDEIPDGRKFTPELINVGLFTRVEGGVTFHKWLEYQPAKADVEKERADHAARQKAYVERKRRERDAARAAQESVSDANNDASHDGPVTPSMTDARPDPTRPDPTVVLSAPPREEGKQAAKTRGHRIPADFAVTSAMLTWAQERVPGLNVHSVTEKFINHWTAESGAKASKLDWVAAWRNWLLGDYERRAGDRQPHLTAVNGGRRPGERKVNY